MRPLLPGRFTTRCIATVLLALLIAILAAACDAGCDRNSPNFAECERQRQEASQKRTEAEKQFDDMLRDFGGALVTAAGEAVKQAVAQAADAIKGAAGDLLAQGLKGAGEGTQELLRQLSGRGDRCDTPPTGQFCVEYYNNVTLNGSSVRRDVVPRIDFVWGRGTPAEGVNPDSFSVRWIGKFTFDGEYTFVTWADDRIRLYLDDEPRPIIDDWQTDHGATASHAIRTLRGEHIVRVEYSDTDRDAVAQVTWQLFTPYSRTEEWAQTVEDHRVWGESPNVARNFAPRGVRCMEFESVDGQDVPTGKVLIETDQNHRVLPVAPGRVIQLGDHWIAVDHGAGRIGFYVHVGAITHQLGDQVRLDDTLGHPSINGGDGPYNPEEDGPWNNDEPKGNTSCQLHFAMATYNPSSPPAPGVWNPDNATWSAAFPRLATR